MLSALAAVATTVAIATPAAPGPAKLDKVYVTKYGSPSASKVLVLQPGFEGGAGDFSIVGPELARRVPGLQVWALDRRTQGLEDTSVFDEGDPARAFDYYLQLKEVDGRRFSLLDGAKDAPFARDWGLAVAMNDLHAVIRAARRGGRSVILGGHSLGGSLTLDYASWDFGGRPGWKDLAGLVCIDGGGIRALSAADAAGLRKRLADLRTANPFAQLLGGLPAESAGLFSQVAALYALKQPDQPSPLASYPLIPAPLRPPVPATNLAVVGYAFDKTTSPDFLALSRIHSGKLAASGDPRGWADGELHSLSGLVRAFAGRPNATEWYFPQRLSIDVAAGGPLRDTGLARDLGLRLRHAREVALPLYGFQTDLSGGRLLKGLRAFARQSRVPRTLFVDRARTYSHLDPLMARPASNDFLRTVVPFLRRLR